MMFDQWRCGVIGVFITVVISSCQASECQPAGSFVSYHNDRYHFEFLYPKDWIADEPPSNWDGRAFRDPNNPDVEIRGWAGYSLNTGHPEIPPQKLSENFTTAQGVSGELEVNVGSTVSSMTLTLVVGPLQYNWRGQSPSQKFPHYYELFYYVASEYQIPQK